MTLLELLAATALLLVVLAAVGAIFRATSQAVGTSESMLDMMTSARSIERQLASDVGTMNRNGFLVIRSRLDGNGQRYDQLSFLATGAFGNSMGMARGHAAHIWWGQLAVHDDASASDQGATQAQDELPTGPLGRHATVLMASENGVVRFGGQAVPCFSDIRLGTAGVVVTPEEWPAQITSGRWDIAGTTPSQIAASIRTALVNGRDAVPTYEADAFCYRFKTLSSVYGSQVSLMNGAARMGTIALPNVTSFAVEWASKFDSSGDTEWYGLGGSGKKSNEDADYTLNEPAPGNGTDGYVAIFSVDTPSERWPAALRVTFHMDDPTTHLAGGRTFVDVIKVPE